MPIHALITTIGTSPEPAIFLILDRLNKVLADLVGRGTGIPLFAQHDLAQFLFIPVVHSILLLRLFLSSLNITRISVQILFSGLPLDIQVMTELALLALLAIALFMEHTEHGLRIHTERNLLRLQWLKQLCGFLLGVL